MVRAGSANSLEGEAKSRGHAFKTLDEAFWAASEFRFRKLHDALQPDELRCIAAQLHDVLAPFVLHRGANLVTGNEWETRESRGQTRGVHRG